MKNEVEEIREVKRINFTKGFNEYTYEELVQLLEESGRKVHGGRSLIEHFGKWKSGLDGVEYQKACRDEWD
jgi:hypothetical protein